MKSLFQHLRCFATEEYGPTAVEYAVMLALIIAAVTFSIATVGTSSSTVYANVSQSLNNSGGGGGMLP